MFSSIDSLFIILWPLINK